MMNERPAVELIQQAAALALPSAALLLAEWLPDGRRIGSEWVSRNEVRGDRAAGSFGVNLDTGLWHDFADSSAHGGDLVSLLAYLRGCRQIEAAREIDQRLCLGLFDSVPPTPEQLARTRTAELAQQEARAKAMAALEAKQAAAAAQAAQYWRAARRASREHPYLERKGLTPYHLRQLPGGRLLVPLCLDGTLVNLQTILPDGGKRFLKGGRLKGCYSPIGVPKARQTVYVCEGWATGATLHEHTGAAIACALTAGNLLPVAQALRARFGELIELVIAGDDDRQTLGNPGRSYANRAGLEVGALVVFPEWPPGAPESLSDFNDLHLWRAGKYRAEGER